MIPLVALILVSGTARAQGLLVGARAGASLADIAFEPSAATSPQWFPTAGGFVTLPPRWGVSLQPEVIYSVKGARLEGTGAATTVRLTYVEVPVLGRILLPTLGRRIYLAAGPSFGWLLGAHTRTTFAGVTEEIDIGDEMRRFDLGICAGGGVVLGGVELDARYTHGVTDIDKDTSDLTSARNRAVSLTAGWRF